jgi:hypothetical protein
MRSFWTIEEMVIVIEDYLDRLDTPLTADLLEFSVALNIEVRNIPVLYVNYVQSGHLKLFYMLIMYSLGT